MEQERSGWRTVLRVLAGLALVAFGILMAMLPGLTSLAAGVVYGSLLIAGAIVQALVAVVVRPPGWGLILVGALAPAIAGYLFVSDPVAGVIGLTVLVALYMAFVSLTRIVLAFRLRPLPGWGWLAAHGVIALVLCVLVLTGLPATGLFLPGTLLAIETMAAGFSTVMGWPLAGQQAVGIRQPPTFTR